MPKEKEKISSFLTRVANQYPGVLRTDNSVLLCKYCNCVINGTRLFSVKQHFNTEKHKIATKKRENNDKSQSFLKDYSSATLNTYHMDICTAFLEANIPIKKISHPSVINFLEKYINRDAPSETTLRSKYVPLLYEQCLQVMRSKAMNKCIWVSLDETTDSEQRLVANFIFGILDDNEEERGKCYLLNVAELDAANASNMAAFFNNSLHLLWPEGNACFGFCLTRNTF